MKDRNENFEIDTLRSKIAALEQMLEVYENSVIEQSDKLYKEIFEHKQTENALRESEERFRKIFEDGPIGMVIAGLDSRFIKVNKAFSRMLGYDDQECIGRTFLDLTYPDDAKKSHCLSQRMFKGNFAAFQFENRYLKKNGDPLWCSITATPMHDPNGNIIYILGMVENISGRKLAEGKLAQKNVELEKAYIELKAAHSQIMQREKMASLGQLAAGVAHEINNPMSFINSNLVTLDKYISRLNEFILAQSEFIGSINGGLEAGLEDKRKMLKLDYIMGDAKQLITESIEGADRVKKIVLDLKSFSRVDRPEFDLADINSGLESTINIVWNELKYKVTLKREYGNIPMTMCNSGHLNQVFMNLLINAAQAIENQGEITVKTWDENGFIHVSISDTGCGIPEDMIDKIFDPFFTTKEIGKGTGLGLSLAYDIIKKHNGKILVESKPGRGTTFTITIPIVGQ